MFFRNLTLFRFPVTVAKSLKELDERLAETALKPVGAGEMMSRGFVSPFGPDAPALSHRIGDCVWLTLGGEDKIFGRTGLLAHTYMLGPNGDSNGCVSFKDYYAFLNAYRNKGIKRLAVLARVE